MKVCLLTTEEKMNESLSVNYRRKKMNESLLTTEEKMNESLSVNYRRKNE